MYNSVGITLCIRCARISSSYVIVFHYLVYLLARVLVNCLSIFGFIVRCFLYIRVLCGCLSYVWCVVGGIGTIIIVWIFHHLHAHTTCSMNGPFSTLVQYLSYINTPLSQFVSPTVINLLGLGCHSKLVISC